MPLIHEYNNLLTFGLIYLCKEVFVSLVDKDLFEFGEENVSGLDEPVDGMRVKALLGEG